VVARRVGFRVLAARSNKIASAGSLPLGTSNRSFVATALGGPGILDQDGVRGCTGFTIAECITTRFSLCKAPIALVSPIGCYTVGRDIVRVPGLNGQLPLLIDNGLDPDLGAQGVQTYGVCSAVTWGNFPADPATINLDPTPAQLEAAKDFVLQGAYFISGSNASTLLQVLQALASQYPVSNAVASTNPAFDGYSGGVIAAASLTGSLDHYTMLIDYQWLSDEGSFATFVAGLQAGEIDMAAIANLILYGVNSWGESWGESDVAGISGGLYRVAADALSAMDSFCVWDVTPVAGGALQAHWKRAA
jgi:hypothetical protein